MNNIIISVDGTAGSGKQRIAKYISQRYKLYHLDSGILYRRLSLLLINKDIDLNDIRLIKKYIGTLSTLSARSHRKLRSEKISKVSSKIAKLGEVRRFINMNQKKIVKKMLLSYQGCIIDGRDIGSNVFKEANIKLYIDVKTEIRAKRRHKQLIELGEKSIYAQILKEINLRDKADKNRKESPLIIPKGAIVIDNSVSFKKTTNTINRILKKII